jgi:hypothetical protein
MEDAIALLAMGLALEASETYFALAATPTRHHSRIERWVSHNTLERMLDWCRRNVTDEYDYQPYTEPLLGEHAIAVRFYFVNPVDAAMFEARLHRFYALLFGSSLKARPDSG